MQSGTEKPQSGEWRDQILESLSHLFAGQDTSALHGIGHARAVEALVLEILTAQLDGSIDDIDVPALQSAAPIHDAGFAHRTGSWSLDCFEHIEIGKQLASEILARNASFRDNPERIRQALWLIEHHDDTTYSFPSATRDGFSIFSNRVQQASRLDKSLAILQEADSRVHVTDVCVDEASQEWLNRGVPLFANCSAPVTTWRWMDSVIGNIRLLGKRAVLDAYSQNGYAVALDAYYRLEDYIKNQCDLAGIPYEPEACPPHDRRASIDRVGARSFDLEIVAFHSWYELERIMRSIPLLYDKTIHPYQHARLQSRLVDLDALTPMSLYVMRSRLEEVLELHDAMMMTYCFGIWDLSGLLEFRYNSPEVQRIGPPIVEDYVELAHPGNPRLMGLLDGLHRCCAARKAGLSSVRAVVASGVPFPLVPLPVDWKEIRTYESHNPPPRHFKRRYRYQALIDFPFESYQTSTPVTGTIFSISSIAT